MLKKSKRLVGAPANQPDMRQTRPLEIQVRLLGGFEMGGVLPFPEKHGPLGGALEKRNRRLVQVDAQGRARSRPAARRKRNCTIATPRWPDQFPNDTKGAMTGLLRTQ